MRRYRFIVARDKPALYDRLVRSLAGMDEIEVILDRRLSERRRAAAAPLRLERRRGDRRLKASAQVENDLRALGWTFVRVG